MVDVEKSWRAAQCRGEVFPPDTILTDGEGNSDVCAWAVIALQRALAKAGMPAGQAAQFVDLVWRCGDQLDWQPKLAVMADDWDVSRQAMSQKISAWQEQKLLGRHRKGTKGLFVFEFPSFDKLIELIQAFQQPHGLKGRSKTAIFGSESRRKEKLDVRRKENLDAHYSKFLVLPLKEGASLASTENKPEPEVVLEPENPPVDEQPKGSPASRLYGAVCRDHKARLGKNPDKRAGGRWRGTLKTLLGDGHGEIDIGRAVERWFGADRRSYGPGLFKTCLEDADTDLTGAEVWREDPRALRNGIMLQAMEDAHREAVA